jgi:hypothetical protein
MYSTFVDPTIPSADNHYVVIETPFGSVTIAGPMTGSAASNLAEKLNRVEKMHEAQLDEMSVDYDVQPVLTLAMSLSSVLRVDPSWRPLYDIPAPMPALQP